MKQIQSDQSRKKFLALAFLLPFLGYSLVMLVSRFSPFGNSSILYSDMYHQYYPFFVEFRRVLRSGGSLVYNWSLGLGVDYLGLIAYYLASPLNLLSVLVPEGMLLGFFSMLVPVKLGLLGCFWRVSGWDLPSAGLVHGALFLLLCAVRLGSGVSVEHYVAGYLRLAPSGHLGHGQPPAQEALFSLYSHPVSLHSQQLLHWLFYLHLRGPVLFCL